MVTGASVVTTIAPVVTTIALIVITIALIVTTIALVVTTFAPPASARESKMVTFHVRVGRCSARAGGGG